MNAPTSAARNLEGFLGVLMLDTRFPRPPGDIGNAETFQRHGIDVRFHVVEGASPERIVKQADRALLQPSTVRTSLSRREQR